LGQIEVEQNYMPAGGDWVSSFWHNETAHADTMPAILENRKAA